MQAIGEGVALFPAASVAYRNNDVPHEFRQDSDFYYLSGFEEPDSILLLSSHHPEHRVVLFVEPSNPERARWDGPRAGLEGAVEQYGADVAYPLDQLVQHLPQYLTGARRVHVRLDHGRHFTIKLLEILDKMRGQLRRGVVVPTEIVDPSQTLHRMRMSKSALEVDLMRHALSITRDAHHNALRTARSGAWEFEVEAELLRTFRAHGSPRAAYGSIVGSGNNATILHYRANNARLCDGDLVLIDAGCEWQYYASDITRTFPVNGYFTPPQRALYDIVLAAEEAAIGTVKPGATLEDVHHAALSVLVDGLISVGLCVGSRDDVLDDGSYRRFFMHKTSHWLGMDVHDVGDYAGPDGPVTLKPGYVLTVEPGLYVPKEHANGSIYGGIGVRIEDNVLVTPTGVDVLSADIPKRPYELEALLAER
ncbi:MAG: aminopeptidase P N-terminal domain-containing protein [Myxococcales bacterium]|nr:aminopeptidase P N-terminal domain-containing protein [Myxococcales bacterium]MCB9708769.1 aminopeptidase P N-terminal domain-containing protein [Myxococcales bacterium]